MLVCSYVVTGWDDVAVGVGGCVGNIDGVMYCGGCVVIAVIVAGEVDVGYADVGWLCWCC